MKHHILLLLASVLFSCQGQTTKGVQTIPPTEFAATMQSAPNPQLIDVRTPGEFAADHLTNASNIDWNGANFSAKAAALDKKKPVFVYCKSGGRSAQASNKLLELGFTEVYNMDGGIMKWNSANLGTADKSRIGMTAAEYGKLLVSDKKVLINFSAAWCAPCKKMKPYLTQMERDMTDSVKIIMLDADQQKTLMADMKLDVVPTMLLYDNNKLIWKHSGYISEADLKKQL